MRVCSCMKFTEKMEIEKERVSMSVCVCEHQQQHTKTSGKIQWNELDESSNEKQEIKDEKVRYPNYLVK